MIHLFRKQPSLHFKIYLTKQYLIIVSSLPFLVSNFLVYTFALFQGIFLVSSFYQEFFFVTELLHLR